MCTIQRVARWWRLSASVFDFFKEGRFYNAVVTVCSRDAAERCAIFPGALVTLHWSFDDPARFEGSDEEIMVRVRQVRDAIAKKVKEFVDTWPEAESAAAQGSPTEDLSAKMSPTHGSTAQNA